MGIESFTQAYEDDVALVFERQTVHVASSTEFILQ